MPKLSTHQKRCLVAARELEAELGRREVRYWTWSAVGEVLEKYSMKVSTRTIDRIEAAGLLTTEGDDLGLEGRQRRNCYCHWHHWRLSEAGLELAWHLKVTFDEATCRRIVSAADSVERDFRYGDASPAERRERRREMFEDEEGE